MAGPISGCRQIVATPWQCGYDLSMSDALPSRLPNAFTAATARVAGVSADALRRMVSSGRLELVARGVYRRQDAPLVDLDLVEVALRAPMATICLETALVHHELTDHIPLAVDVALPRGQRLPVTAAPVRWHRFHAATFELGREELEIEPGLSIGLYSAARTLADLFRLRHQEGADLAHEALRNWLRAPTTTPAELLRLARRIPNAEVPLRRALEVLL